MGSKVGQRNVQHSMTKLSAESELLLRCIALVGVLVLVAVFATDAILREIISPEIGLAYRTFASIKTLPEALSKFISVQETWYRSLTFYATNHVLYELVDIHNLVLIKTVSFCVIVMNAIVATLLARQVLGANLIESVLTFSLIVTHPLYYRIAIEGSGTGDPVFTIFLNLFLIGYLTLLEASNMRLGYSVQLSTVRSGTPRRSARSKRRHCARLRRVTSAAAISPVKWCSHTEPRAPRARWLAWRWG
jgi:hypothetical protein